MQLFVGLGNPGAKYARNRHNIGFMALDEIARDHGFAPWRAKFQGQICEGMLGREKVLLLKPETFMNLSGQSVGEAMRFYKLEPADVTVFHDELDLAPARVRAKTGGGHAGHNGLRSIHGHIGEAYHRIRLGIGHPGHKDRVAGYVLSDFAKSDEAWLDDVLRGVADGAPALAEGDTAKFSNAVALRVNPPRSGGGAGATAAKPKGPRGDRPGPKRLKKPKIEIKPVTGKAKPAKAEAAADAPAADEASAAKPAEGIAGKLQKLADKFRG